MGALCQLFSVARYVGQTICQHPIKSVTAVATASAAWLYFGTTPLLSVLVVVALLSLGAGLIRWLWRRMHRPTIAPASPNHLQRNGKRPLQPCTSALSTVS